MYKMERVTTIKILADGEDVVLHDQLNIGNNGILEIDGNVTIMHEHPIIAESDIIIRGTKGSSLTVIANALYIPAIGMRIDNSNVEEEVRKLIEEDRLLKSITVEDIDVTLKSRTINFTMGTIGSPRIPDIKLINGHLYAPEFNGNNAVPVKMECNDNPKFASSYHYHTDITGFRK